MVALNYQTHDRQLQYSRGLFRLNGGCGYVLKPAPMRDIAALTDLSQSPPAAMPSSLTVWRLTLLCGHLLPKPAEERCV